MLAPAVGLALMVALLGTVAGIGAAGTLGSVVLATLVVIAVVAVVARFASRLRQTRARLSARALIAPALAVIGPMALFLTPFVLGRTLGPVALYANDPWYWYVPMETYLSDYEVGQALDRGFLAAPLQISDLLHLGSRAGFDATIAAIGGVTGLAPDQLFTPTIAAVVGTMGATVYYLARRVIGGARWVAVGAAWLTCTSVVLVPAFEGSGRALIAYTLFPVALYATWKAITRTTGYATIGLAGVAVAGLVSAYSEGIPALVLALVALLTWALLWRPQTAGADNGSTENQPKRSAILLRFTAIPVLAFALSPIAAMRAIEFLRGSSGIVAGSPSWGVVADNVFPWVFGLRNLFESRRQALLEPEKLVVLYALVAAGLMLVALGMRYIKREHRAWLISGAGAIVALSAWLYFGEHCDYCWYRSLAFLAPFLGILVAAGLGALVRQARGSRKATRTWLAWAGAITALLFVAAVGRTSLSTITTASGSQMMTSAETRAIRPFLQDMPRSKPVLVEGTDSGPWMTAWFWSNLATMLTANAGRLPVYDRSVGTFVNYGNVRRGIEIDPYRPDYSEVVTPYGGIKGPRRVELTSEDLVVMRRGPIDVSPQMKGRWSRDPREPAATAIPHISGDFDLVVAGPPATDVAVSVTLEGPVAGSARFAATSPGGIGLPTRVARPRPSTQTICILAKSGPRGTARITLTPRQPLPILVPGYVQPDEALPALPKDLNLVALRADRAGSPSACSPD
jgi:hypothetical protein